MRVTAAEKQAQIDALEQLKKDGRLTGTHSAYAILKDMFPRGKNPGLKTILPVRGWRLFACVCVCVNLCEKLLENKTFRKILSTFFLFFSSKSAWSCVVAGPIVVVIAAARGISLLEFESVLKIGWCETLRCNSS